ncbi:hypothetical protein [Streptomyces acidiscabies]|uniref:Lipoprotein n=1 Tax=Streptomyces acidiscabies TaxID=42234 RepID=A0ABU4LXZ7_9ACTN|nr:hypothetical protein [Streptomyces acidiscabies]MDX3019874.1 hypothetical protein [Streptomyces acidiscabies]
MTRHLAAVALAALALTACSSSSDTTGDKPKAVDTTKLDDAGKLACGDFAKDYKAAVTKQARLDLANKVNKWAPTSKTDRIADSSKVLANGANGTDGSWKLAADTFAQACLDAGWKA